MIKNVSIVILLQILLTPLLLTSQSCEKVVDLTINAINDETTGNLTEHLADDFTIAGQKPPIAQLVLEQVLSQLGDKVIGHSQKSSSMLDGRSILKYDFEYEGRGFKETTFVFNEDCKISELKLFDMEVKKMCSDDSEIETPDSEVIKIPFRLLGKLIQVQVMLNGVERNFLLDSGCPRVILNSIYVEKVESSSTIISSAKGVNGSVTDTDIHMVDELDFYGIKMNDQEVITSDLSNLETELEEEIYGLIGYDLIRDYDILFDYEKEQIFLVKPVMKDAFLDMEYAIHEKEIIPFQLENHIPVVTAYVGDKRFSYGIDCGAESNLLDDDLFVSLQNELLNLEKDTLSGLGDIEREVKSGELKTTRLGKVEFYNLNTVFSDISHLNQGYNLQIDGLIGYEVLAKQPTLISYARKELILLLDKSR